MDWILNISSNHVLATCSASNSITTVVIDIYNIVKSFPSGYYADSFHTIRALSNLYLISHIDTFHTPYRVFADHLRLAVVYTKHL